MSACLRCRLDALCREASASDVCFNHPFARGDSGSIRVSLHIQRCVKEILQHVCAIVGDDRFGVELHANSVVELAMTKSHDSAMLVPCCGLQHMRRERGDVNNERVISTSMHRVVNTSEDAISFVPNQGAFAMNKAIGCFDDISAKGGGDALVAHADAKQRHASRELRSDRDRAARVGGFAGARRDEEGIGGE